MLAVPSTNMQLNGHLAFTLESVEIHLVSPAQSVAEIIPISGLVPSNTAQLASEFSAGLIHNPNLWACAFECHPACLNSPPLESIVPISGLVPSNATQLASEFSAAPSKCRRDTVHLPRFILRRESGMIVVPSTAWTYEKPINPATHLAFAPMKR